MKIIVLISDYDQTFYINDDDIKKNIKAVEEFCKKGNIFVIATGRSYLDFMNKVELYNIKYDYVILNHGATIIDKDSKLIADFYINNVALASLKNDLKLEKSIKHFCCSSLESRVDFKKSKISKIYVKYKLIDDAKRINEIINKKYSQYVNSYYISTRSIEITPSSINKSKAIGIILQQLNTKIENIYTVGDGYSDIKMIRDYNGFSMENSVEELKKIAKKSVKSVSELIYEISKKDI